MFNPLFSTGGLSLDRLRALLAVAARGSIARAADNDPVRQSQYSRQIKELEDFFQTRLVERAGKGIRLTRGGRELSRISRFFMMGLGNFQRGCLAEAQTYRLGAGAAVLSRFLVPAVCTLYRPAAPVHYQLEEASGEDVERRLHDLTLDFGVIESRTLSRPLQTVSLRSWRVFLWVPKKLGASASQAAAWARGGRLPCVVPAREMGGGLPALFAAPGVVCDSFLDVAGVLDSGKFAGCLPEFLAPEGGETRFWKLRFPAAGNYTAALAWNPRLLRLNPHAARRRDSLVQAFIAGSVAP